MPLLCCLERLSRNNTQHVSDREENRKIHNEGRWSMHHKQCRHQPLEEGQLCPGLAQQPEQLGQASLASPLPLVTLLIVVHHLQRALFPQRPCPSQAISLC